MKTWSAEETRIFWETLQQKQELPVRQENDMDTNQYAKQIHRSYSAARERLIRAEADGLIVGQIVYDPATRRSVRVWRAKLPK